MVQKHVKRWLPVLLASACSSSTPAPEFERFDEAITPVASDYPDVPGVILLDRGTLQLTADAVTKNPIARLRRLRRVKILRETGASLANIVVSYDPGSVVTDLKARVVLPSGKAVNADPETIRDGADAAGNKAKLIQAPLSEPEVIVEYTYDLWISDPRFIPAWVFQSSLPTLRSEYAVVVPQGFSVDLRFSDDGTFVDRPPERFETDEGTRFFWSMANLRAIFSEPGMPTAELLSPRAHVIMLGAKVGSRDYTGFGSWDDIGAWFVSRVPNWAVLSPEATAEAKRIAGETSAEEQSLKLLAVVARDLAWEPGLPLPLWQTRTVHPDIVLKEKKGNAVSRGLLLVALLRAIGLNAYPALVAYRDRGVLLPDLPTIGELDGVIAVVPRNEGALFLDPSQLTVSADVPSPFIQGTRIVTLREDGAEVMLVPVSKPAASRTAVAYELKVDEHGDLFGNLQATLTGAEAGELRGLLFKSTPEDYAEVVSAFLRERGGGIPVESASISDLTELRRPLGIKGTISLKRVLKGEGTSVAMTVGRIIGSEDSERLREVRRTPLKIGAPKESEVIATIVLPEEWEPEGALPPFSEAWPGGRIEIKMRLESARRISLVRKSTLEVLDVTPERYADYRAFRESVRNAEAQTLSIKRPAARSLEY
jgi:hypothetical protein